VGEIGYITGGASPRPRRTASRPSAAWLAGDCLNRQHRVIEDFADRLMARL
jgi:hypothetical protein